MSFIYVVGDLHFGHSNICNFRQGVNSEEEHREIVVHNWNSVVTKRDIVYVLGDAVFTSEALPTIDRLKGQKFLVLGNHDKLSAREYLAHFSEVYGLVNRRKCWLSHAPVHPLELRGKINVHGHVHYASIPDKAYRNVSLENTIGFRPVKLEDVINNPESVLLSVGE